MLRAAEGNDSLHLLAIGDFGSGLRSQQAVARGMATYLHRQRLSPQWLLLLGDNFYGNEALGGGLSEARWKSGFEEMYPPSLFPCPCPAVLGNHDYHDTPHGPAIQLAYASSSNTRWKMPAKWYRMDLGKAATFLFLDTNLPSISGTHFRPGKAAPASLSAEEEIAQWAWLKSQLQSQRGTFTFVVGHHPVYSNGAHGDQQPLIQHLAPELEKARVHFYIAGHDHDLQHLELAATSTSFLISGGGGAETRSLPSPRRNPAFARPIHGFSHIEIQPERVLFRHLDAEGNLVHAMEKRPDNRWSVAGA